MQNQTGVGTDATLIENEQKGFDYFMNQLKSIIFQVLYVLRSDDNESNESMFLFYLQNGLDYLQMHTFPFNDKIYYLWKADTFLTFMLTLVNLFNISTYIPNITYLTLLVSVYILLGIILLIIIDIIYVSYSFSTNRFKVLWPLYTLRSTTSLVVTVLFLPITETLTSILQCSTDPESGQYKIDGYDQIDVECWKDWHLFHALITLIFMIIFVAICAIVAYAFFEPSMISDDRTARQDSKGEVAFIINKVTCQLMFCFLDANQSWILVLVTFLLSVWLFKEYNFEDPYYDYQVGKFYQIISSYYLYSTSMLLLCKLFESSEFTGSLIAWLIGLPFLVTIMLLTKKSKIETLVKSQSKFRSGEQLWNHIRYVLQLIQQQEKDKNSFMLLVGYIEKHKETCDDRDCFLKSRKRADLNIRDMIIALIREIDKMFKKGLQKFPRSSELRVFYALFLYERQKSNSRALEQFQLVKLGKPALYQQFITYRYMKIINDKIGNTDEEKDTDIVNEIAFKNHLTQCEQFITVSSNLHKEFWIELKEDQPDLGRLMNIGARITKATNSAKENYSKMMKYNVNYQPVKMFANFVINVLNDEKTGSELVQLAQEIKKQQRRQGTRNEYYDVDSQQIPYLTVGSKKSDPGLILNLNTLFTTFFGYQKEELIGKKINLLMPQVYADAHDQYISDCSENIIANFKQDGQIDSSYLDQEQLQYFKHKNGYLIPMLYRVSFNQESSKYLCVFRNESATRCSVIFYVAMDGKILELSSSALMYFDLDLKKVKEKETHLGRIIPELNKLIATCRDRVSTGVTQLRDNFDNVIQFTISVSQIMLPIKNNDSLGSIKDSQKTNATGVYLIKLDKLDTDNPQKKTFERIGNTVKSAYQIQNSNTSSSKIKFNPAVSLDTQPFRYETNFEVDQHFAAFLQELYTEPRYEDYKQLLSNQVENQTTQTQDFGENISTRRLINNQLVQIDEEAEALFKEVLEEEESENSIFRSGLNQHDEDDDFRLFRQKDSQELIRRSLSSNHKHGKVREFTIYSFLWIIFILIITILQYYFCYQYFEDYKQSIKSIEQINSVIINVDHLTSRVLDLCFNETIGIEQVYEDIKGIAQQINEANLEINSAQYAGYYRNKQDQIRLFSNFTSYTILSMELESSILFVTSQALNFSLDDYSLYEFEHNEIQNVIYNVFNVIQEKIEAISLEIFLDVSEQMDQNDFNLLLSLGILVLISVMAMSKFIVLMLNIKVDRENILFLFLDIPQTNVVDLLKKVDKYLKGYVSIQDQKTKFENYGYESSEDEQDNKIEMLKTERQNTEEEDAQFQQQQNRKKIIQKYRKNKLKGNQGIIIQFVLIALSTLVFAIYNIISSANERSYIKFLLPQFYYSSFNINRDGYYINCFKVMLLDHDYLIQNETSFQTVLDNLSIFVGNQKQLEEVSLKMIQDREQVLEQYMESYYGNICEFIDKKDDLCLRIINGNLELGIYNVEQHYLDYFRKYLSQFNRSNDYSRRLDQNLFEIDLSLYNYVRLALEKLTDYELNMIIERMDSTLNIQLILVILFICFLLLVFTIVWLPFLNSLNVQMNQNIQMLTMIPLGVITKKQSRNIRRFIKSLIKNMDISHQKM